MWQCYVSFLQLTEDDPTIPRDQPASERGGRRERVSKDERRERKQQRKVRFTNLKLQ